MIALSAVAWATANIETATRLANMSVDESGMGGRAAYAPSQGARHSARRLRQKSMGIIEEIPEKGIVKYAKPAGVVAALIPVTSPYVTPAGMAIYALKCKDAVIFCPHPASKKTTTETVRVMRAALKKLGAPEDILQCVEKPSIPLSQELCPSAMSRWRRADRPWCARPTVRGKPAYGVGAGNATMVFDETADIEIAAQKHAHQQDQRQRLRLLADGNLIVDSTIYDAFLKQLQIEAAIWSTRRKKRC